MPLVVNGSTVSLDINATNNASPVIKQVAADIGGLESSTNSASDQVAGANSEMSNMTLTARELGVAVGIVTTGVTAMIAVFEYGEIAAANERLRVSGEQLSASYGESLDEILSSVKETSLGTVSEMSIIESANKAMMLGVSGSSEQLSQLMEIAALRGRAMGISTTQAFDDMVRGIGRLSPMILDNLGIVVDSEGTYQAYAESLGKTSSELTRNEKIQALLNSVLKEGNELLSEAGGLAYDNAAKYERWNAELENTKNTLIENTLGMSRFADMGASLLDAFTDAIEDQNILEFWLGNATGVNIFNTALGFLEDRVDRQNKIFEENEQRIISTDSARWAGLASLYETTSATQEAVAGTEDMTEALSDYYESVLDGAQRSYDVQQSYIDQQDTLKAKQAEVLNEINVLLEQGWSPYSDKVQDLQSKYDDLGVKIDETAEKHRQRLGEMQYDLLMTQLSTDGLTTAEYEMGIAAGVAFGVFDQEAAEASLLQLELTKAVNDGRLSVEDYGNGIQEAMEDGVVTAAELREIIASIPGEKTVDINVRTNFDSKYGFAAFNQGEVDLVGRASGGPVSAGQMYEINERGTPELLDYGGKQYLMMPSGGNGYVTPLAGSTNGIAGSGGGGVTIQIVVQSPITIMDEEKATNTIIPLVEQAVLELQARGNLNMGGS